MNAELTTANPGWNDANVMGGDLPNAYTPITMPLFLSQVKACLAAKNYTLSNTAIAALVAPCLAATVRAARLLIYGKTV